MAIISHNRPIIADDVEAMHFSHESGFYNEPILLKIDAPRGEIYYTLDGSDPTADSIRYEAPIVLSDPTSNENVYSMRTDMTTAYQTELVDEYAWYYLDPLFKNPDYPIDKCNVVRAVVYYGDGNYSEIKTGTYYIGFNDRKEYDGLVISITTDPDNLFGYEDGIYVMGKAFDEFKTVIEEYMGMDAFHLWYHWIANYSRGVAVEKPASCQFFVDNRLVLSQKCGIRVHGGGSRAYIPKSLNLNARDTYGKYDHFPYDFFENGYYSSKVTLFMGGEDNRTKLKDYLVSRLCSELEVSTMEFRPCTMFLDGEYWGVYWLNEKFDKNYIHFHYKVLPDNVIMVKNGLIEEGKESEFDLYSEMIDFVSNSDMRDPANLAKACEMMDIDSFIDYYASMLYMARYMDWNNNGAGNNVGAWRSRKVGTGKYNDGKWRWMVFDMNMEYMSDWLIDFDSYEKTLSDPFFASMMKNDEVRNRLLDRIFELGENEFSDERIDEIMVDYHDAMDDRIEEDFKRFYEDEAYKQYPAEVEDIVNFVKKRKEYLPEMVEKYR